MFLKGMTVSVMVGALAWQTVQASSISTRVRVLENKVSQFERQANQERAQQHSQVEQVQRNSNAIQALGVRVDDMHRKLESQAMPTPTDDKLKGKKTQRRYLTDGRFTDRLYSFP